MSGYNSENTKVLATHEQAGGNTRMLLFHEFESGRTEYVIGSYFQQERKFKQNVPSPMFYSWDWGHYFGDVVAAVDYWKREVLGIKPHEPERFICPDCSGVYQEHPVELVYENGSWECPGCGCSTSFPEEDCCIRIEYKEEACC